MAVGGYLAQGLGLPSERPRVFEAGTDFGRHEPRGRRKGQRCCRANQRAFAQASSQVYDRSAPQVHPVPTGHDPDCRRFCHGCVGGLGAEDRPEKRGSETAGVQVSGSLGRVALLLLRARRRSGSSSGSRADRAGLKEPAQGVRGGRAGRVLAVPVAPMPRGAVEWAQVGRLEARLARTGRTGGGPSDVRRHAVEAVLRAGPRNSQESQKKLGTTVRFPVPETKYGA